MAKHEGLNLAAVQAAAIRGAMENRFAYLYITDRYNGADAGEFGVLESILCDSISDDDISSGEGEGQFSGDFAGSEADVEVGGCVGSLYYTSF